MWLEVARNDSYSVTITAINGPPDLTYDFDSHINCLNQMEAFSIVLYRPYTHGCMKKRKEKMNERLLKVPLFFLSQTHEERVGTRTCCEPNSGEGEALGL